MKGKSIEELTYYIISKKKLSRSQSLRSKYTLMNVRLCGRLEWDGKSKIDLRLRFTLDLKTVELYKGKTLTLEDRSINRKYSRNNWVPNFTKRPL